MFKGQAATNACITIDCLHHTPWGATFCWSLRECGILCALGSLFLRGNVFSLLDRSSTGIFQMVFILLQIICGLLFPFASILLFLFFSVLYDDSVYFHTTLIYCIKKWMRLQLFPSQKLSIWYTSVKFILIHLSWFIVGFLFYRFLSMPIIASLLFVLLLCMQFIPDL